MNEKAKTGILIAVAVVALAVAGFFAMKMVRGEEPEVVQTIQGAGGEKEKAMANQGGGVAGGGAPGTPAPGGGEVDLAGAHPGG